MPIDSEAKKYLATKNHKGMIKKLGKIFEYQQFSE